MDNVVTGELRDWSGLLPGGSQKEALEAGWDKDRRLTHKLFGEGAALSSLSPLGSLPFPELAPM